MSEFYITAATCESMILVMLFGVGGLLLWRPFALFRIHIIIMLSGSGGSHRGTMTFEIQAGPRADPRPVAFEIQAGSRADPRLVAFEIQAGSDTGTPMGAGGCSSAVKPNHMCASTACLVTRAAPAPAPASAPAHSLRT